MSEWKEYRLGDIALTTDFVANGSFASLRENVKYLESKNYAILVRLYDYHNKWKGPFVYVDKGSYDFLKKSFVEPGDLIIANVGANAGESFLAPSLNKNMTLGPNSILIKGENCKYLFYYFNSAFGKWQLDSIITGSAQPKFNKTDLRNLLVKLPNSSKQSEIVEILTSLDDKIELNNNVNKELEYLAQLLFKRWFYDFEFPNENGEPYKTSGGEMIDSEFGEIPKGWLIDYLSNLFDFLEGPGLRNWQYRLEGMPFINIRLLQNGDILKNNISFISNEEFEDKYKHFALKENDLVLSTSGTLGKSAIVRKNHLPLMLNTSVIRFRPIQSYYKSFMYQYLQSKIFIDEVKASATGSVQLNFGPIHLKKIKLIKPYDSLIKQFENAVSSIYEQIQKNRDENDELSLLRDTILPKLISGELQINNN